MFAQGYLGWMYSGGRGTEIDYDLGFYWSKRPDKFDVFSLANLGWYYENGFGVTMSISEAKRYYELASVENNEFAKQRLKEIKKNQYENKSLQSNISFQCNKIKNEKNFSTILNSETPNIIDITYDPSNNELLNYVWDKESIIDNYHTVEFSSITKILEIWEKDSQSFDQDKYFFEMYGYYIAHLYKVNIKGIDYQCEVIDNDQLVLTKIDTKNFILEPIEEDYVSIKGTYFRSEPNPESDKLGKLKEGEVVYVVGKINNYFKVEINEEKYGFIFHKLLTPFAPTNNQSQLSENIIDKLYVGSYFALVIGNNKYQHWSRLDSAVNDANKIGQILSSKYNFKVTSLIDANRDEIMNAIFAMRENLKENDNLLIYFAGHGELDEEADRGYWIPVDGILKIQQNGSVINILLTN